MAKSDVPKWIIEQGSEVVNLLRTGFLKSASASEPKNVNAARKKYLKALAENPSLVEAESMRLGQETKRIINPYGERKIITPESLQGNTIVPIVGDRTYTGHTIVDSQGFDLSEDVKVDGGAGFAQAMEKFGLGWASNNPMAQNKQNNFDFAANKTDSPVVGVFSAMGDDSNNFATPIANITTQQLQQLPIPRHSVDDFDKRMRVKYKNWLGLEHPEVLDQLMGRNEFAGTKSGAVRSMFVKTADSAAFRDVGFPSRNQIRDDVVEPELLNVPIGSSGYTTFKADIGASVDPMDKNVSYTHGIKTLGYNGGLFNQYPARVMFPDVFNHLDQKFTNPKKGTPRPFSEAEKNGSLVMNPKLYQRTNQQWLDGMMDYGEKNNFKLMPAGLGAGGLLASINSQANEMEGQYSTDGLGVLGITPEMSEAMAQRDALDQQRMAADEQRYGQYADDQMMPREQTYSEQLGNYLSNLRYGDDSSRQQQEMARVLGGILDFTPVGSADALKLGAQQREAGNSFEGWLNSIGGAAEAAIPLAGLGYKYGKKGVQGLMEAF
jgi:hypothetical protein